MFPAKTKHSKDHSEYPQNVHLLMYIQRNDPLNLF